MDGDAAVEAAVIGVVKDLRVGTGFDAHPFSSEQGRRLVICGQSFPGLGLAGHSDADVGAHAVADAILGAAGVGGIGDVFSDQDPANSGADSMELLASVVSSVLGLGFTILNVDLTVICERPHIAPHRIEMSNAVASVTGSAVTVKAKRPEGMGALGRNEGVAAVCSALLLGGGLRR